MCGAWPRPFNSTKRASGKRSASARPSAGGVAPSFSPARSAPDSGCSRGRRTDRASRAPAPPPRIPPDRCAKDRLALRNDLRVGGDEVFGKHARYGSVGDGAMPSRSALSARPRKVARPCSGNAPPRRAAPTVRFRAPCRAASVSATKLPRPLPMMSGFAASISQYFAMRSAKPASGAAGGEEPKPGRSTRLTRRSPDSRRASETKEELSVRSECSRTISGLSPAPRRPTRLPPSEFQAAPLLVCHYFGSSIACAHRFRSVVNAGEPQRRSNALSQARRHSRGRASLTLPRSETDR